MYFSDLTLPTIDAAWIRAPDIAKRLPRWMRVRDLGLTEGEATGPLGLSAGCASHQRCTRRLPICSIEAPALTKIEQDHSAACFLHTPDPVRTSMNRPVL
jgi:hypothetical protein